jgi:hypothetical protein
MRNTDMTTAGRMEKKRPDSLNRGPEGWETLLPLVVDVFPHHHGVVNHDAERDDEGKQGDHVDAATRCPEEPEGADDGDGDAHGDPEGETGLHEESQGKKNEEQP